MTNGFRLGAGLGDRESAFTALDEAYAANDVHLVFLTVDPKWDDYRSEPRFKRLVERCGFMGVETPRTSQARSLLTRIDGDRYRRCTVVDAAAPPVGGVCPRVGQRRALAREVEPEGQLMKGTGVACLPRSFTSRT
jgi:hypothetical protein